MLKKWINRYRLAIRRSFGVRILAAFVVVLVLVLTTFTLFQVYREGRKAKEDLRDKGTMLEEILAREAVMGVYAENAEMLKNSAMAVMRQRDIVAVNFFNPELKVLYAAGITPLQKNATVARTGNGDSKWPTGVQEMKETENTIEFTKPVLLISAGSVDESLYIDTEEMKKEEKTIGYVRLVLSKSAYHQEIISIMTRNGTVMLFFILSGVAVVYGVVKKTTRPLETLTEHVKEHGAGRHVDPISVLSDDEIGKLAAAFNDMVAARGHAEEALRESEDRYRRLVELSPDAIYVQQGETIVFSNAAGARLMGETDSSQLLGRPISASLVEDDRAGYKKQLREVQDEGHIAPIVLVRYVRSDGTEVEAEASAAPFLYNGRRAALVIARDVTERKGLEEQVRNYQRELYAMTAEMTSIESRIEERERHLIAADLHDYVGQNLVVTNLKLGSLTQSLEDPDAIRRLGEIRQLLKRIVKYTRSLTVELGPPVLAEIGLEAAVETLAESFEKAHGLPIGIEDDGQYKPADSDTRYSLFRCVRELLMNVVKHAKAKSVTITMARSEGNLLVAVADDGVGFEGTEAARKRDGFGLFAIRDRMKRLGGSCEILPGSARGATVTLKVPIKNDLRTS